MAHPVQQKFCMKIKEKFPNYFRNKQVLDIGSLDINGNNKYLFENCEYVGLDVVVGKNVDVVSVAHEYEALDESFDVVLSTNALEHDMYYPLTLKKMVDLLKSKGLMFFSVACKWKEHGTLKRRPEHSGTTQKEEVWKNYYKNLNPEDIYKSIDLKEFFSKYDLRVNEKDLVFWGIKKGKSGSFLC